MSSLLPAATQAAQTAFATSMERTPSAGAATRGVVVAGIGPAVPQHSAGQWTCQRFDGVRLI
eukprot:13732840-Alexandrium_andersonii.AAC.1